MPVRSKKRQINLLPQSEFESSPTGRVLKWILTTFRFIVIFVELIVIMGFIARFWLDIKHSNLNDEIEQKENLIKSYSNFEKEFKLTQKKLAIYKFLNDEKYKPAPSLEKIVKRLPQEITLTSYSKKPEEIIIKGQSLGEQNISQFVANLKAEGEFENITISQIESNEESIFIDFTINISPIFSENAENET